MGMEERKIVEHLIEKMNAKIEVSATLAKAEKRREEFGLELVGLLYKYDLISWEKVQMVIDPINESIQFNEKYLKELETLKKIENPYEPWGEINEEKFHKMIKKYEKFWRDFNSNTHPKSGLMKLLNLLPEALSLGGD